MPNLALNYGSVVGLATSRLLGRTTAGTGQAEAISVGGTLTLSAGSLGLNLGSANVWSSTLAVGTITNGQVALGGAVGFTTPTLDTPGFSKPFAILASNTPTTQQNAVLLSSGDGNAAIQQIHTICGGSLASPTNSWSGGCGTLCGVGYVGGSVAAYRTFSIIEFGNRGSTPSLEAHVLGRIQLRVANGAGTTTGPGLTVYNDQIAITNQIPLNLFNVGYQNTFDGVDTGNDEIGQAAWSSNIFSIGPVAHGTGTLRAMKLTGASHTIASLTTNGFVKTSGGTGALGVFTGTQATAQLDNVVGDSGSGGTKGLVPAPGAGDAAALKFLKADGTWAVPAGGGSSTPGGSDTQVQYNNAGGFGGSSGITLTATQATLTSPKIATSILDSGGNPLIAITATGSALYGLTITNAASGGTLAIGTTAPTQGLSTIAGVPFTHSASNAVAGSTNAGAASGGDASLIAGNAARKSSGNANGGNVVLTPGTGIGTGIGGTVDVRGAGMDGSAYYGQLQIYNQFTDASNYSRLRISGAAFTFETAGSGSSASMEFINGGSNIYFRTDTTRRWKIESSGSSNGDFAASQTDANIRLLTGDLRWDTGRTVAALGTPANGSVVYCTDAKNNVDNGVAVGSVVANSGAGCIVARINGSWRTLC